MEIALILLIVIGASLGYGLHGILLLRWCGRWTRNRRLLLWVTQMLFPFTTGLAGAWLGEAAMELLFGSPVVPPRNPALSPIVLPLSFSPSFALATAAFVLGPALVIRNRPLVLVSAALGVVTAWVGSAGAIQWTGDLGFASFVGVVAWHAGALGAPLAFAWRVRMKRKRALGGRACLDCGYDLTGVTLDRCPECGAKRRGRHEGTEARRHEGG